MDTGKPDSEPTNVMPGNGQPAGVPTVDPATGSVSTQPIITAPSSSEASATPPSSMPEQPAAPMVSNPMIGGASVGSAGGGKKRGLLLALVVVAVLVLGAAGYVFGYYLPNKPAAVYSSSLEKGGKALDALIDYSNTASKKDYKSYNFTGSMQVKSSGVSFDGTLTGGFDPEGNADVKLNADILGQKMSANVRSVHAEGTNSPDLYVQLSGIKSMLDQYGLKSLDSLDGQWIGIDHTLLDTYAAALDESAAGAISGSKTPTPEQVEDALAKVQTVNKDYIFTTNSDKAVLTNAKYVAAETKDGRATLRYTVGYSKEHLQAYVNALKSALNSSKLNDWSKDANDGKNLSEMVDFNSLNASIRDANSNYTFDIWVDKTTKLIRTVQFTEPSDKSSTFALTQGYTGGDEYPFTLTFSGKNSESGETESASVNLTLNTSTNKTSGVMKLSEGSTSAKLDFAVTPSNDTLKVTAPAGAMPVTNLLSMFGLGSDSSLLSSELSSSEFQDF
jgi:hypothetical protein